MSNVSQMSSADERKERRRLHLREIAQETESVGESDSTDASAAPAEEHEAVGAILRAARVARGEEAAKVAAILKMRREQLVAIEENDLDRLPGRAYTVGFVRAYASYLGLDAEALVQQFKDENATEPFAKPVEHVFPEASTETANFVPSGSILIWALLIAMIIYAITYLTLPERKTSVGTTAKANESGVIVEQPKAVTKPTSAAPKSVEASPTAAASKSGDVSDANTVVDKPDSSASSRKKERIIIPSNPVRENCEQPRPGCPIPSVQQTPLAYLSSPVSRASCATFML